MEVFARSNTHVQNSLLRHRIDEALGDMLAGLFALLGNWIQLLVRKYSHSFLQSAVALIIVWAFELRTKPRGFSIGNHTQIPRLMLDNLGLLAFYLTYA